MANKCKCDEPAEFMAIELVEMGRSDPTFRIEHGLLSKRYAFCRRHAADALAYMLADGGKCLIRTEPANVSR